MNKEEQLKRLICKLYRQDEPEDYTDECMEDMLDNSVHFMEAAHQSHQLKPYRNADRAEVRADSANLDALHKQAQQQNPELQSNPYSRWQQKRAIKKEYAAAKAGGGTVRASEVTAKAAKRAAEDTKKASEWIAEHKKGFLIALALLLVALFLLNIASSCSVLVEGGVTALGVSGGWRLPRIVVLRAPRGVSQRRNL